jgi:cell division septation protein DedD
LSGAIVLLAAGIIIGRMLVDRNESGPQKSALETVTKPTDEAQRVTIEKPEDQGVKIEINGLPEGASIYYDKLPVPVNPFRVDRKKTLVALRVVASGYQEFVTSIIPDKDQTVEIKLTPQAKKETGKSHPKPRPKKNIRSIVSGNKPASAGKQIETKIPKESISMGKRGTKFTEEFED